ncbi:acetyltransferase [Maribellus sediminis]|uniref:acetyltransferase n=1 Tax=Maribellus sediminis TaxID=2696285 RepID=UPI001F0EFD79|nr:acetyltransferase [Maribellus sediminis]
MKDFTTQNEINILGFSGQYLALLFESLRSNLFKGSINIILNDGLKRSEAEFETDLEYKIYHAAELKVVPNGDFVFCSNKPSTKKFLYDFFFKEWEIEKNVYLSLCHSSGIVASTVKLGNGFYMEPLSVVSPYTEIGFGVTVNRNCSIGHHSHISDFCSIHPGANIAGNVYVGEGVTIGPGSTIFSNIRIGRNSIIGGGSVVTKNIPDNVLAFGNPCKIVKEIEML